MTTKPLDEKEIFSVACEIESDDARLIYLQQVCSGNTELLDRVAILLRMRVEQPDFLESDRPNVDATLDLSVSSAGIGATIGPYKIREQLAEGGMGVVYVAEQTKPVRRKVALKVIKPGMASKDVVARFEAERQALAMMDHPNIARVFDGGATDSGQPYFVMELVQGLPITDYCDERRLSTRERLELFAKVCRAVQHAHQKGIIHRDLKPSNVLVAQIDDESAPKVIDFGVAKAVSQKLTEQTVYTQFSQMIGTPLFMSPEQAEMGVVDIDTRSDVYSLGALLYELLTGNTPFDRETIKQVGFDELRRVIREDEPRRPSAAISTLQAQALLTVADRRHCDSRKLSNSLKGELDWIVMKALEKDRNRRYESPSAMAADIERYLDNEPVEACPPSVGYRMRKFAQRNRTQIAAGSLLTLALMIVVGVSASFVFARQAREQAVVQSIKTSLTSARTAIDTRDLVLAETKLTNADARLDQSGKQADSLKGKIKELRREIKEHKQDAAKFTQFMTMTRSAQDQMTYGGMDGGPVEARAALALFGIEDGVDWVVKLKARHLPEEQVAQIQETAYETLLVLGDFSVRWRDQRDENITHNMAQQALEDLDLALTFHKSTKANFWVRGEILKFLGERAASEEEFKKYGSTPARTALDHYLPGHTAGWRGDLDTAMRSYHAAPKLQPNHFNSLYFLANRLSHNNRDAEALGYQSACIALRPNHRMPYLNRCESQLALGYLEEATADYVKALECCKDETERRGAKRYFSQALIEHGYRKEAEALYSEWIAEEPKYAPWWEQRANNRWMHGRPEDAISDLTRAISLDASNPGYISSRGHMYAVLGDRAKAISDLTRAISLDASNPVRLSNRGCVYARLGDHANAINDLTRAISLDESNPEFLSNRGQVYAVLGDRAKAITDWQQSIELGSKDVSVHFHLAILQAEQGDGDGYRSICEHLFNMVKSNRKFKNDESALVAWMCAVRPDAVADYSRAKGVGHGAVQSEQKKAEPKMRFPRTALGALLFRMGAFIPARDNLQLAIDADDDSPTSRAYPWFVMAMVQNRLGNAEAARAALARANEQAQQELNNTDNPPNWNRKATLELLKKEAETILGKISQAKPPNP